MARLDRSVDRLKMLSRSKWQPLADHPDLVATQEALQLQESFAESARVTVPSKSDLRAGLQANADLARQLRDALKQKNYTAADKLLAQISSKCVACHQQHRN